jgi:glycosyltransferase involved in cell wall biosynthesis
MRVALVVHGLPPRERTGVETHVAALAEALARAGAEVLVLAVRKDRDLPHLAERRERRNGYSVDWLVVNDPPRDVLAEAAPPGVAEAVGEWLDREQPDVVHVHHVKGLGWGLFESVSARGIPLVFTAHDFYAFCHRVTHLRPDLARCSAVGDAERCARCDLAVRALHGRAELGDWHVRVFPGEVAPDVRASLTRCLDGQPDPRDLEQARERRKEADALRARALSRAEVVLAPTQHLLALLERSGIEREKLRLMPYAIESKPLLGLTLPSFDANLPVRFGFLGGLAKHKGAHVLLEALRDVRGAELEVFGDSTDRPYVERVRALCAEVGARWQGSFDRLELRAILSRLDVVCVPSLWDENAPFVIREAFAAGRPVIASRTEALLESVRDGVDGVLVEAGDIEAWRATLRRLAEDRALVHSLAVGVRPPPSIRDLADDLLALYGGLAARRAARELEPALPEHLWSFQRRRLALQRAPISELYERVRGGLSRLRVQLHLEAGACAGRSSSEGIERARELLGDRAREARWRAARATDDAEARVSLQAQVAWLSNEVAARDRELSWRRADAGQRESCHARELEALREEVAARQAEALWLRELASALERQRDALETEGSATRRALEALASHERWLREEARAMTALLGAAEPLDGGKPIEPEQLAPALAKARDRAAALNAELGWRRAEMLHASSEGGLLLKALLAQSALGRRFQGWRERGAEVAP